MPRFDLTEAAIIAAFEHLLKKKPFSKISVKDITEYCGISRNTFYYHYQDKYDLMTNIFYSDVTSSVPEFEGVSQLSKTYIYLCKVMFAKKSFYYPCLQYSGQNSLFSVLTVYLSELWDLSVRNTYYDAGIILTEYDTAVYARMNAHALVGMIRDWVEDGMGPSFMENLERTDLLLDQSMKMFSKERETYNGMIKSNTIGREQTRNVDDIT